MAAISLTAVLFIYVCVGRHPAVCAGGLSHTPRAGAALRRPTVSGRAAAAFLLLEWEKSGLSL